MSMHFEPRMRPPGIEAFGMSWRGEGALAMGLGGVAAAVPWMPWHPGRFVLLSRLKPLLQGRGVLV